MQAIQGSHPEFRSKYRQTGSWRKQAKQIGLVASPSSLPPYKKSLLNCNQEDILKIALDCFFSTKYYSELSTLLFTIQYTNNSHKNQSWEQLTRALLSHRNPTRKQLGTIHPQTASLLILEKSKSSHFSSRQIYQS